MRFSFIDQNNLKLPNSPDGRLVETPEGVDRFTVVDSLRVDEAKAYVAESFAARKEKLEQRLEADAVNLPFSKEYLRVLSVAAEMAHAFVEGSQRALVGTPLHQVSGCISKFAARPFLEAPELHRGVLNPTIVLRWMKKWAKETSWIHSCEDKATYYRIRDKGSSCLSRI